MFYSSDRVHSNENIVEPLAVKVQYLGSNEAITSPMTTKLSLESAA